MAKDHGSSVKDDKTAARRRRLTAARAHPPRAGRPSTWSPSAAHRGAARSAPPAHGFAPGILERHGERRVDARARRAPARSAPPRSSSHVPPRQLVHAGEREAQGRRRRAPRRAPASRRRTRRRARASPYRGDEQEQPERVARGARLGPPASRGRRTARSRPARPSPVPATTSRARKPRIDVTSCSGKTNAMRHERDLSPSAGASHSSWRPATSSVAADSARNPSGSGLPIGRRTLRAAGWAARSSRHHERLRRGLLHARPQPAHLRGGLLLAALHDAHELLVAGALRALAEQRPGHVALGGHEVEVVQVAQQAERARARAAEELGVQALGLVRRLLAVAPRERGELLGVPVALVREGRARDGARRPRPRAPSPTSRNAFASSTCARCSSPT